MSEATRTLHVSDTAGAAGSSRSSSIWQAVKNGFPYFLGFFSLFFVWHVVAVYVVASVLFPPPYAVLLRAIELLKDGVLVENVGASLQRIILGFVAGSASSASRLG